MAIQNRRGADADFDPNKVLPGEFGFTTDGSRKVYAAFAPNDVKEVAFKEDVPAKTSDLANDTGFVTKTVADLINYYTKSETYTQEEINQLVSTIPKFSIQPVPELPTEKISTTTVYLLTTGEESQNLYTEYIYVNGAWEKLGTQKLDLSGYALKSEIVDYVIDIAFKDNEPVASQKIPVNIKANEKIMLVNVSESKINVLTYDEKNTENILTFLSANETKMITVPQDTMKIGAFRYNQEDTNVRFLIIRYTADKLAKKSVTADKLAKESVTADKLAKESVTADKLAKEFTNCEILRMELDTSVTNIKSKIIRPKLKAGMTFYVYSELNVNLLSYDINGENQKILINGTGRNALLKITLKEDAEYLGLFSNEEDSVCVVYVIGEYLGSNIAKIAEQESKIAEQIYGNTFFNDSNTKTKEGFAVRPGASSAFEQKVSDAIYAYSKVYNAKKARLSGRSYNASTYSFYSYFFTDKNSIEIGHGEQGNDTVFQDIEVDIPDGAYMIYVNGDVNHPSSIKLLTASVDFDQNFNYSYNKLIEKKSPKVITLGDSITMLGTSDRGWVKYFLEKTNGELIANVAMNSAVLSDYQDTIYDGNPQQNNQVNNVLGNQIQKIINNSYGAPDIILIAIGTNGGINISNSDIKNAYYDSENNLINLDDVNRKTNAGAYRYATEKLHELYPNAVIFWCAPIMGYQKTRSAENAVKYAESLRIATEYSGQIMIDTIRCGINGVNEKKNEVGEYLQDGLHPSIAGAKKIGYYNAAKVMPFIGTLIN